MAGEHTAMILRHIRNLVARRDGDRLSDRALHRQFATVHDDDAFAMLVRRHGPMVLRVCERVLHHAQDVEDPVLFATKTAVGAAVPACAAALAGESLKDMVTTKVKVAAVFFLGLSLLAAGASLIARQALVVNQPEAKKADEAKRATKGQDRQEPKGEKQTRSDRYGDPLPNGALARLGTLRQRAADTDVAVTADGKEVVTVGPELTVRRFDARTGELLATRQLPMDHAVHTWLSPRGTFVLASHCRANHRGCWYELELWDLARGKGVRTCPVGKYWPPCAAAFSGDERRVAVAACTSDLARHRVIVWELATSKSQVIWSQKNDVKARSFDPVVALSPDGKRLVACHLDQVLHCWEVEGGKLLWQSKTKNWSPFLFFSPDGQTVVTAAGIGVAGIQLWDAATGKRIEVKRQPPREAVYPIGFSPDGRLLAFETGFEGVVLWQPGAAKAALHLGQRPRPRDAVPEIPNRLPTNFAFTPDGKGLIRRRGALQRWDLTSGKPIYADTESWGHTQEVTRLVFSPDGSILASSSKDQAVRLWKVATARPLHVFPKALSSHLAFTADGRHLFAVHSSLGKTALGVWNVSTGRPERGYELADRSQFMTGSEDKELRVTADGKKVLMLTGKNGRWGDETVLTVWDAVTHECLVHKQVPWDADSLLMPDGTSVLAVEGPIGALRLLAIDSAKPRLEFPSDRDPHKAAWGSQLALSPNGRLMAAQVRLVDHNASTEYDPIRLADMATGRKLLKVSVDDPALLAFSADNRLFAVAAASGVRLWETASRQEVGFLKAHNRGAIPPYQAFASALAFSPDGRMLATGHADSTILLWDGTLRDGARGGRLTDAERDSLWTDLAGADAARAYAAVWRLVDDPGPSMSFLKGRLKPVAPPSPEEIRSLLRELDSDRFKLREAAEQKLRALGERAEPALRKALGGTLSLEVRRRVETILSAPRILRSREALRPLRGVQVLEQIGSREARRLLRSLAGGAAAAQETKEAKASLERLDRRTGGRP